MSRKHYHATIRGRKGVTVLELLVVLVVIAILAAIAYPMFSGAQDKAKEATVKCNMRNAQIAAESYAVDNSGSYPQAIDDAYKSYFSGGSNDGKTAAPHGFINPFTRAAEWPIIGAVADITAARNTPSAVGTAGQVEYSPIGAGTYAIRGANAAGTSLPGPAPFAVLVLSNQ